MNRSLSARPVLLLISLAACLTLALAACAPAAQPSPAAPAKPTEAPKPAAPAASPATAPAAQPAASPAAAAPAAAPVSSPAAAAAGAGPQPTTLRMAFVPSADSGKVLASGKPLGDLLAKEVGIPVEVSVPTSYAAVIEAMGANNVEIGWLAPLAYVLAHQKFETEVILASVRQGSKTYRSQIIVPADSPITDVKDLRGKKFAFVDAASASGYLYPSALLKDNGIDPKKDLGETVNAGGHDKVVIAVYNKQVDAGATFGDSIDTGPPTDARTLVRSTLPDVMDKVKVLAKTDPIPNDTVSVRRGLSPDLVTKIRAGLLKVAASDEGKQALKSLYSIDGLAEAADKDYDPVRKAAQILSLNLEEELKPK